MKIVEIVLNLTVESKEDPGGWDWSTLLDLAPCERVQVMRSEIVESEVERPTNVELEDKP